MKTIGLIGGMSWESTITYYQLINRGVQARLGGVHSARLLLHSFDFDGIVAMQRAGDWDGCTKAIVAAGEGLKRAGADVLVICANTMHLCASALEEKTGLPVLHIADPLGRAIRAARLRRVGLLGTRFTMERPDVLRGRLKNKFDLEIISPDGHDADDVHRIIYDELCCGRVLEASRTRYREVMTSLIAQGAEGIILGCTEIPLLVGAGDAPVPLFDTTALHAAAAVDFALDA